ncbi:hypothetical protein M404DRAFT_991394 [Pisolithus tinctorius Marx 270]|uniref:Uncharacterized protein n=1 Tax=Pisolithus tinctorius Marx 270 TaxID=870435 RepID=A0A0C3PK97_PISTI|nr:hypothetical protein M404DRAFT_991394 [Pisolithus tinctorius Marx 270]
MSPRTTRVDLKSEGQQVVDDDLRLPVQRRVLNVLPLRRLYAPDSGGILYSTGPTRSLTSAAETRRKNPQ